MEYFVYILQSDQDSKYYIGSTKDLEKRLDSHNRGSVKSTRHRRPLKLLYFEEFENRTSAVRREREIKSYKGGQAFKELLKYGRGVRVA